MNKTLLGYIIMIIIVIIIGIVIHFNKNHCIKNGGKVITNNVGIYDKCIYGGNN